jgi:FtsP/CotA-like multicopper oxidase with cupredoxin domain
MIFMFEIRLSRLGINQKSYCCKRTNSDANAHLTEGDVAEIYVHNELNEDTSLHWHGLFLPNKEDVPNLTQMPSSRYHT